MNNSLLNAIELHEQNGARISLNPYMICGLVEVSREAVQYPNVKTKVCMASGASHYVKEDYDEVNRLIGQSHGRCA